MTDKELPPEIEQLIKAVKTRDPFDLPAELQVRNEIGEAVADLYRTPAEYHHLPWPALDKAIGGMPGGEICFIVAFSSNGKTLFLTRYAVLFLKCSLPEWVRWQGSHAPAWLLGSLLRQLLSLWWAVVVGARWHMLHMGWLRLTPARMAFHWVLP